MKYFVQILVYFMLQHLPFIGTVTIEFNSIGYIHESIVLQCQDTNPINVSMAEWYRGGSPMDISSSRYTQTKTSTGFNLTISSLAAADVGGYRCGIEFGKSAPKSLTIYYNTSDVNITKLNPKGIEITFIAFPDPIFEATVKQDGVQLDVNWNVNKSTQASGAIRVSLQNSTAFANENKIYTVHVKIISPVTLDVETNIIWADDCSLGLALGVGLGIATYIYFISIVIAISRKRNTAAHQSISHATGPNKGTIKLILGFGFGIIGVTCIVCIVILVVIGKPCARKVGTGLGPGLGISFVGCIIAIVILVKKEKQNQSEGPEYAHEERIELTGNNIA